MYQGTNKTACASQRQIADAMLLLMREIPFSELTVSSVCNKAGISRATFYSLFQSKENVIVYLLQQDCCDTSGQESDDTIRLLCRAYCSYVERQADLLRLLSEHHLMPLVQEMLGEAFGGCDCFQMGIKKELQPYAASYIAAGLTSISEIYIRGNNQAAGLEDIAYSLLSGMYLTNKQAEQP